MIFTEVDRAFIKNLYLIKGCGVWRLIREDGKVCIGQAFDEFV